MALSDKNPGVERKPSKKVGDLEEFFTIFAKIVGALTGFAALFVVLGYTIILSFISKLQLYGLTNFPQEFYKEATLKFVSDALKCYRDHYICLIAIISLIIVIYLLVKYRRPLLESSKKKLSFIVPIGILSIILITLKLDILPDKFLSITEIRNIFLFMVSVPIFVGIFLYLSFKFRPFMEKPYRYYYLMILLFLGLFISIPVSYGDSIFDIDIYPVIGFDYADTTQIESIRKLRKDINEQGEGDSSLFFLMGHTRGREIFFDNQALFPPAKMILVERDLIKFIRISRRSIITLRTILLEKSKRISPVPISEDIEISKELPEELQKLIQKEKK